MSQVIIAGDTSGTITLQAPAVSGSTTLTLPATTDTLVGRTTTDTLTNKSIVATQLTGTIASARLPAGSVLQVVSTTLTTGFSASVNNSFSAVTGLTAIITPSSASNKVMIIITMTVGSDTNYLNAKITKGGTAISGAVATAAGNRSLGTSAAWPAASYGTYDMTLSYLDSPATTSATTYGVQIGHNSTATLCVNQSQADDNIAGRTRGTSTITVMEIAA